MMKKIFYKQPCRCILALVLGMVLASFNAVSVDASEASQNFINVTGTVFSNDGEPLTGAAVFPKGRNTDGVIVDFDGNFTIRVAKGTTLVFSFLGFQEEELPAQARMDVVLSPDRLLMDEAVVVGYTKQNIREITSSVARVDMDNLENNAQVSLATMLAGQAAGLQTVVRSGVPGASGAGIVIRGNNSLSSSNDITGISNPLYIIDGIPMALQDFAGYNVTDNDFLSTLNPQDIQSIDILKDAAATAIYGSRGANGVVIITTRKGTSGAPRVTARASVGVISRPSKLPVYIGQEEREKKLELLNQTLDNLFDEGMEWVDVRQHVEILGYTQSAVLTDIYNPAFNNAYDYQDMFYQDGINQTYDLSLEGGAESNSYRVSLGHYRERGVLVGYGVARTTLNASLITDVTKRIHNELVLRYTNLDRKGGLNDADGMRAMPTSPTSLPSSLYFRTEDELQLLSGQLGDCYNKNVSHQLSIGETLRIKILEGLSWDNNISYSMDFGKRDYFLPSTARDDDKSFASSGSSIRSTLNWNSVLNYNQTFGKNKKHAVVGLLGLEVNSNVLNSLTAEATDGMSDYLKVISGYKKEDIWAVSDIVTSNMLSFFAMASYGYANNRYKIEGVFRRDASSRFGANNRWASFPSVKALWAFSEEPWMKATKSWMDFGKVRVSYGTSGDIYYDPLLQYNSLVALQGGFGANLTSSWSNKMDVKTYGNQLALVTDFNKIANNDLSWSRTKEVDYGLDLELFKSRVYISADLYSRYMSDLVYTSTLPSYVGFSQLSSNLVDMVSHGVEVSLTGYLFPRKSKVQWDWTLNLANNQTKIARMGNGGRDYLNTGSLYAFIEGAPAFQYYMYEYQGTLDYYSDLPVNPLTGEALRYYAADAGLARNLQGRIFPGMPVFTDVDGDYLIQGSGSSAEYKIIEGKTPEPKISGGLSTNFKWKNLSVRINSSFALGHWIYNTTMQEQLSRFDDATNFYSYALYKFDESKFWTGPEDDSYYPMIYVGYMDGGSARSFRHSSMFLERGDYWSLDNVTISYDLPRKWTDKINMRGINVYVTGQNLAMWKASSVFDPRMVSRTGWYNGSGYPISRSYIFGVQLQF